MARLIPPRHHNDDRLPSERGLHCRLYSWAIMFAAAVIMLALLTGCESRHLTHTWPDGSVSEYQRTTIGRSNTEGVTLQYGELKATLEASGSSEGEMIKNMAQLLYEARTRAEGAGQ